ncbi:hypothetical protein FIE12Z_9251 [Fusarium flagelliforme]|uniref:Uncharacterized protein n=1 Tax=Fusarium flagelliforme TaxID=2675880 RepID=A0A395MF71_9HYPO|nr:hypothetical protein FIE12Z_9251 [Fusarium flagelliforme]
MTIGARSRSGCAACKSQRAVQPSTTTNSDFPEQSEPELLESSFLSLPENPAANANQVPSPPGHGGNDWVDETFGDIMPDLMSFDFMPIATPPSVQTPELLQLTDSFGPRPETAQPPDEGRESSISPATSSNIIESLDTNQRQIAGILQHSVVDRPLNDCSTILIEYYFKDTAAILALFDSEMNPFRSTVSRVWASSELIYFTLQSMAASYLANVYPQLLRTGIYFRQKAIHLLDHLDDSAIHEQTLMALFMIGGTASWFDVNDTGAEYFPRLKHRVQSLKARDPMLPTGKSLAFFENTLACWEMFLAFVVDDDENGPLNSRTAGPEPEIRSILPMVQIPHPLTGVAHEIHTYLAKVGRLVRKNRRRAISKHFHTRESILEVHREMDEAAELEAALTNLQVPMESAIVQTGDCQTPTWHLTTLAEVYRLVGLLQLYQVFPDTLVSRINCESADTSAHQAEERLRQFTLQTVDTLRSIPAESGTKDFHPFLIVAVCSGLTIPIIQTSTSIQTQTRIMGNSLSLVAADVHRARGFLRSRLQLLLHSLPKNPIQRCIDIVEATWAAADNRDATSQSRPVYWMDIMMQNNWETFMA